MGAACCTDEKVVAGVQDIVVCGGRHCIVWVELWICEELKIWRVYGYIYIYENICLYKSDVDADDDDCGIAMIRPLTITIRQTLGRGATPHSWLQITE